MRIMQVLPRLEVGGVERGVIDLAKYYKVRSDKIMNSRNIEIQCPNIEDNCHGRIKVSLNQIRRGEVVVCPSCGSRIELQEKGNGISSSWSTRRRICGFSKPDESHV